MTRPPCDPRPHGARPLAAVLRVAALSALVLLAGTARAETNLSAAQWVARGNEALAAGKSDEALEAFARADAALPDSPVVAYNRGIAHYRRGDFEKARGAFADALRTRDPALEAKAKFNLGNCAYSSALTKLTDLPAAIDDLRRAIDFWRDGLQLGPDDRAARENIETAQLLMKDLLDKEKNRQEEEERQRQDQEEDQQGESEDRAREASESEPKQDEQKQPQDEQSPQDQDRTGRDDSSQDDGRQEQRRDEKQPQPRPAPRELSREDAERMLQAIRDKERARRDLRREQEALWLGRVPVERDW